MCVVSTVNGVALRFIRERSGLTVAALAELSGISQPHLSNIEVGRRGATAPTIKAIADALKVPVVALLGPPADHSTRGG